MESINKVELCGIIGSARTSTTTAEHPFCRFTLATNLIYKDKNGNPIIETTWHDVIAFENENISCDTLCALEKGTKCHIFGRIRNQVYMGEDGIERHVANIFCNRIEILKDKTYPQAEKAE